MSNCHLIVQTLEVISVFLHVCMYRYMCTCLFLCVEARNGCQLSHLILGELTEPELVNLAKLPDQQDPEVLFSSGIVAAHYYPELYVGLNSGSPACTASIPSS